MSQRLKRSSKPGVDYRDGINKATGLEERVFYIRYRDPAGKQHCEKAGSSLTGMNVNKAVRLRNEKIIGHIPTNKNKRSGAKAESEAYKNRYTFDRLYAHYMKNHDFKNKRTDGYKYRKHLQKRFGNMAPEELAPLDILEFQSCLKHEQKQSDTTMRNILSMLRALANWGKKYQLSQGLSFQIDMPKGMNILNEALTPIQITSLLDVMEVATDRLEASFIKMLLFTGRRPAEIAKLRWEDVDLDQQKMVLHDTKTNPNEFLPLADAAVKLLREMPKFSEYWVFPNHKGQERLRLDTPGRLLIRQTQVPQHFRPAYCLRHTFASIAAETVGQIYVIKTLLGHVNARRDITLRYAHVSHPVLLEAVNKIVAKMLERPKPIDSSKIIYLPRRTS